jgi:hypothetical protein
MRPFWHLDAKWLFGLACVTAIIVARGLYSAAKLTERDPATGIFSGVMTTFAKESDGSKEFDKLQAKAAAKPNKDFTIEGVTLPIKGREIAGLSYDEAVDLVVGRIAVILYTDGPDAVEQFFEDTSEADSDKESAGKDEDSGMGPFSVLTQDSHDTIVRIFRFSLIPVLILAVPLIFFSRRFGRLGSPGVVLAAGTAPFALLWFVVKQAASRTVGDGVEGALAEALSPTAADLSSAFLRLLILGAAAVAIAVAGHVGFALRHRSRPTPGPPAEPDEQPDCGEEFPSIGPGGVPQA